MGKPDVFDNRILFPTHICSNTTTRYLQLYCQMWTKLDSNIVFEWLELISVTGKCKSSEASTVDLELTQINQTTFFLLFLSQGFGRFFYISEEVIREMSKVF